MEENIISTGISENKIDVSSYFFKGILSEDNYEIAKTLAESSNPILEKLGSTQRELPEQLETKELILFEKEDNPQINPMKDDFTPPTNPVSRLEDTLNPSNNSSSEKITYRVIPTQIQKGFSLNQLRYPSYFSITYRFNNLENNLLPNFSKDFTGKEVQGYYLGNRRYH